MKNLLTLTLISAVAINASAQTLQDAIKFTDREQFENATSAFKKILAAEPQNGEAWFYLGENYWASGLSDSASHCYEKGATANPRIGLNQAGAGKALWAQGKQAEAQALFTAAIGKATEKSNKLTKPEQARIYREVAQGLVQGTNKDFTKALEYIGKALELDPKDAAAYVLKGDILFDQNPRDGTAPIENYKKAMEINALDAKPVARKAFMYYRAGNFQAAIDDYTNAIAIDATFAPAYSGRAEAYFKARQFDKATEDMNKYLELNKGSLSARVRFAQFLFVVGKYQESLNEINSLEGKGVKNIVLTRLKGYDQVEMKDPAGAKQTLESYFAEQTPDKVISSDYEYYGKALVALGNDSLGAENMLKAARMDRTKDYLFVEAAKSLVKIKRFDEAIGAMREKMAGGKPEVNDYYYLGDVAYKGKRWLTADSAWATYTTKNPSAYQGYKFRARTQAGMDTLAIEERTWAAKPYYEEVLLKMKPEEKEKSKADLEEALNYLGSYYFYSKEARDLPKARCYFDKVQTLNAGTSITTQVNDVMLKTKELKDVAPSTCD